MTVKLSNNVEDSATALPTFWGWHFHSALLRLRDALDDDLQAVIELIDPESRFGLLASRELKLFRRSWIPSKPGRFWFRWSFFDDEERQERLLRWKNDSVEKDMAKVFLKWLSVPQVLENLPQGTRNHITRLTVDFFELEKDPLKFVENWRAVYLQTPTTGTILSHLWDAAQTDKGKNATVFVVQPHPKLDFPGFPPFDYWIVSGDKSLSERIEQTWQAPIELPSAKYGAEAAKFFEHELYQYFFSPSLKESVASKVIEEMGVKLFLFVPIRLAYEENGREWAGVLQIDLALRQV